MFLLVTGASGAGKSTARLAVSSVLSPDVECVELHDVVDVPAFPTLAWRQQATEAAVQRALALQDEDRHLLLSGDPVAAGEVLAAPSAIDLQGVAVCLLDVSPAAQAARLNRRGDNPALMADHQAFARWMRGHAIDPHHMPHVLISGGWEAMRWERWTGLVPESSWGMEMIDTSRLSPEHVAAEVVAWCHRVLRGQAQVMRPTGDDDHQPAS
jgi:energy-coupling factor transporter ATP-binding protein EcfA2